MTQFGDLYSQYYDLLYKDKDYASEVEYVHGLIQKYSFDCKTILDLGCGTGRHDELLCEKGYIVYGVDISEGMLKKANERRKGKEDKLYFVQSKIQDLELSEKFDVIISLFHVLSYQTLNEEVIKYFETAKKHLREKGIFIFDFWYGPAVLTDLPTVRVKRLEDESIRITRIAEPMLHPQKNIVDVNYTIFIENKENKLFTEIKEIHKMRYFFDPELELFCDMLGFKILAKYKWMTEKSPDFKSWNVVWVVGN